MIGRTIGSYTIVDKLGSGGMGEVYLAEHRRIARRAAIKFLLPKLSRDSDVVSRFFNEARATAAIKHPGIVEIYDCEVIDDRAYIVMEFLEGESLGSALARVGSFEREIASVASVGGQIASALAAAHAKGIIHRDLKPENVFLALDESGDGHFTVKILDFGIAKLAADNAIGSGSNTRTGSVLGTPTYMSPEQCRGLSTVDHRADIYALGCIMFELLTGRQVFVKEAPGDLLVAHISEIAPRVSSFKPGVPPVLDDLVARMLAKSPAERPASMTAVVSELEALLATPSAEFAKKIPLTSTMLGGPALRPRLRPPSPSQSRNTPTPAEHLPASLAGGTQLLLPETHKPPDTTFGRSAVEVPVTYRGSQPRRGRALWIVGGLAMPVVALVVWASIGKDRPHARPFPAAAVSAANVEEPAVRPTPSAQDETPRFRKLQVRAEPANAEIRLDDFPAVPGRLDRSIPDDDAPHSLRITAPGHEPMTIALQPHQAAPAKIKLTPSQASPPVSAHKRKESVRHHDAQRGKSAPKQDAQPAMLKDGSNNAPIID